MTEHEPSTGHSLHGLRGVSAAMARVRTTLEGAAAVGSTVLIRGESGTGKELAARSLHAASPRAAQPFVKIDCTALPEALFESELFGHERGAFTGAVARKVGRAELAQGGTLFLDEVGELGPGAQAKLLRLLQDRELERLGGTKRIVLDVRVVAATHRDLEGMVDAQQFRLDLFYRLNVLTVWLPPLRARRDDIAVLARSFASHVASANGRREPSFSDAALKLLRGQRWPGNVRQLQNVVERLVLLGDDPEIGEAALQAVLGGPVRFQTESTGSAPASARLEERLAPSQAEDPPLRTDVAPTGPSLGRATRAAERQAIEVALARCGGNRSQAARILGVSRSTLYAKIDAYGISAQTVR